MNAFLLYYRNETENRERVCVHRAFIRGSFIIHASMNAFLLNYHKGLGKVVMQIHDAFMDERICVVAP